MWYHSQNILLVVVCAFSINREANSFGSKIMVLKIILQVTRFSSHKQKKPTKQRKLGQTKHVQKTRTQWSHSLMHSSIRPHSDTSMFQTPPKHVHDAHVSELHCKSYNCQCSSLVATREIKQQIKVPKPPASCFVLCSLWVCSTWKCQRVRNLYSKADMEPSTQAQAESWEG